MTHNGHISKLKAWWSAARPKTLPAAVAPVLVGSALAHAEGFFNWLPALAALVGALLIQIGTNLANDYFDFLKGVDTAGRKGPVRALQSGLISPKELRIGMLAVFALAVLVGLYLVWLAGWPILIVGLLSLLCAVAYSGGPYPLASYGLGDAFVFLFFGLVAVGGTYYVQALSFSSWALLAAVPVGALITAIIVVNNIRDIETDALAGKRTLAVMMGPQASKLEYAVLLDVAYAMPLVMWLNGWSAWVLLPFLSLPLGVWLTILLSRAQEGSAFNQLLAQTAQLALAFSALFALGLIL